METTASDVTQVSKPNNPDLGMQIRRGSSADEDWLFTLFRNTMRHYIDSAWGWDELLQREGFATTLPARDFQILFSAGRPVACYHLKEKSDHLLLEMIMVEPAEQRKGFGHTMMAQIKTQARRQDKSICLSVLKTNPALRFHLAEGFETAEEDEHSLKMRWRFS